MIPNQFSDLEEGSAIQVVKDIFEAAFDTDILRRLSLNRPNNPEILQSLPPDTLFLEDYEYLNMFIMCKSNLV
jgi:hypothetical protein